MFSYHVVVIDLFYHLDVELFLALRKLRLEDHEEVISVFILICSALGKGWHLS